MFGFGCWADLLGSPGPESPETRQGRAHSARKADALSMGGAPVHSTYAFDKVVYLWQAVHWTRGVLHADGGC